MAKILSGGLVYGNNKTSRPPINKRQDEPESTYEYTKRNIAKIPTLAYETARSFGGVGNVLKELEPERKYTPHPATFSTLGKLLSQTPGYDYEQPNPRRLLIPSTQEANQEAKSIAGSLTQNPEYFTEHRPEDYWAEQGLTSLPFLAQGAAKGGIGLGKAALQQAGILGGAELGREAASALGEFVGNEKLGEQIGGLAGGYLGAKGVNKAANLIKNRPSKTIEPNIAKAEQHEIEAYGKRIKQLEKERAPLYKNAEELEHNAQGMPNQIRKSLEEATEQLNLGIDPADANKISKILSPLEGAASKKELSLHKAKMFQKNLNDHIYDRSASTPFKRIMRGVVNGLNEFIEKTGSKEHTEAWKKAENSHKEFSELKRNRKELEAGKRQEISDRKAKYNELLNDLPYARFGKTGSLALGGLGYFFKGVPGALAGLGAEAINQVRKGRNLVKYAKEYHPEIYDRYQKLSQDLPKLSKEQVIITLNKLGQDTTDAEQEDKKSGGGLRSKILSGGLKY